MFTREKGKTERGKEDRIKKKEAKASFFILI